MCIRDTTKAYDAEIAKSKATAAAKEQASSGVETTTSSPNPAPDSDPLAGGLQSIGTTSAKADKVRNITVNIEKLIDRFEVNTTNMREDMSRVKELVAEAVLSAVNDVNLAM